MANDSDSDSNVAPGASWTFKTADSLDQIIIAHFMTRIEIGTHIWHFKNLINHPELDDPDIMESLDHIHQSITDYIANSVFLILPQVSLRSIENLNTFEDQLSYENANGIANLSKNALASPDAIIVLQALFHARMQTEKRLLGRIYDETALKDLEHKATACIQEGIEQHCAENFESEHYSEPKGIYTSHMSLLSTHQSEHKATRSNRPQ